MMLIKNIKYIVIGLIFAMFIGCSTTSNQNNKIADIESPVAKSPINLSPFLKEKSFINTLKTALTDANVSEQKVHFTATVDKKGIIAFNFSDGVYNQSFKSNQFNGIGILTAKNVEVLKTLWMGCSDNKQRCFEGKNSTEIKEQILKETSDQAYIDLFLKDVEYGTINDVETFSVELFAQTLHSGLSYSNFGVIKKMENLSTENNLFYKNKLRPYYFDSGYAKEDTELSYYFGYGDPDKKQDFTNNTSFSGNVFATANYYKDNIKDSKNLIGSANLTINGANENLEMEFNDYYTLKFNNGNYSGVSGKNNFGNNFNINDATGKASYQGYGDDSVSEVVGIFNVRNENLDINGSFGVVKNPY